MYVQHVHCYISNHNPVIQHAVMSVLPLLPTATCMCIIHIFISTALICEIDTCSQNEVCVDTDVGYLCPCDAGYERDEDDVCSKLSISHM